MSMVAERVGSIDSASKVLGNKWTPLLLRFFLNEPTVRFCQLQEEVGGINPRTLCARLAELEECGIISKHSTGSGSRCTYSLTQKGRDLLPVLQSMQQWSKKYPSQKNV